MTAWGESLEIEVDTQSNRNRKVSCGVEDQPILGIGIDMQGHVAGENPLKSRLDVNGANIGVHKEVV